MHQQLTINGAWWGCGLALIQPQEGEGAWPGPMRGKGDAAATWDLGFGNLAMGENDHINDHCSPTAKFWI